MMKLEDIIQSIKTMKSAPTDDDLRNLPYKKAFIYGRVSSQGQVRESHESIRDIAKLLEIALRDGYRSSLKLSKVEQWLDSIQNGDEVDRIMEEGEVIIDCQDLGLSGSLNEEKRPGLAHLQQRARSGEVGAIYLTEGMSRLSRDRDRVLGYKLLKLLKEQSCRIRTAEGVYNPAIPRDWENLADDIEDSADELKKLGIRLGRRRASKAAEGRHVGSPVCPGYIVEIEGQNRDGSYILGKWKPYPPHQEIVITALKELIKQGSVYKAVKSLKAQKVVFPPFPQELKYMETRSSLRLYLKESDNYLITYNALKGLATNLRLIGLWQWRHIILENNHPPVVPLDLFLQAYEIATARKPKGRAAYAEPMEWAGLLYCYNHSQPSRLIAFNKKARWACYGDCRLVPSNCCFSIADYMLTPPLTRAFLDCLDLTPHAEAVLKKLKAEVSQHGIEESHRRRRETELKNHISNLESYLGSGDPEREETYWRLIKEAKGKLNLIMNKPARSGATSFDLEKVANFLSSIDRDWHQYPSRLRNRLLKLLIDRVELRHQGRNIEAVIIWKIGLKQTVNIERPRTNFSRDRLWNKEEDNLLRMLWPSSSKEALQAALPGRSWESINQRASHIKIRRQWVRVKKSKCRRWTVDEKKALKELYASDARVEDIARKLKRSKGTITTMANLLGIKRPKELLHKRRELAWESLNVKVFHESSSQCEEESR